MNSNGKLIQDARIKQRKNKLKYKVLTPSEMKFNKSLSDLMKYINQFTCKSKDDRKDSINISLKSKFVKRFRDRQKQLRRTSSLINSSTIPPIDLKICKLSDSEINDIKSKYKRGNAHFMNTSIINFVPLEKLENKMHYFQFIKQVNKKLETKINVKKLLSLPPLFKCKI